jgi:hypothetical protein
VLQKQPWPLEQELTQRERPVQRLQEQLQALPK